VLMIPQVRPADDGEPPDILEQLGLTEADFARWTVPPGTDGARIELARPVGLPGRADPADPVIEERLDEIRKVHRLFARMIPYVCNGETLATAAGCASIEKDDIPWLREWYAPVKAPPPTALEVLPLAPPAVPWEDFLATASEQVPWIARDLVVEGGITLFLGAPASFKSMAALELGFASAAGNNWLGLEVESRPICYVSNEKSKETVADRIRHLTVIHRPQMPFIVAHRKGIAFGNEPWARLVEQVRALDHPIVILDTLASLSPGGFDENSTKDMGDALFYTRQLTDADATVILVHHPKKASKDGGSNGPLSGRGSGRLDGEVDGWVEFHRKEPTENKAWLHARPKDGQARRIPVLWNLETFCLEIDQIGRACTATTVADTVIETWDGEPLTTEQIAALFPGHSKTHVANMVSTAHKGGLIRLIRRGRNFTWAPAEAVEVGGDEWPRV
jgi:hypothetical protein